MSTSKSYIPIKNFALKEIVSPMSSSEFIDGINFIKKEIEHLKNWLVTLRENQKLSFIKMNF